MTEGTLYTIWWISIALLLVVTLVVWFLLAQIFRTAQKIEHTVADVWTQGKMVAANTIHIPMLRETNRIVSGILKTAGEIVAGAQQIEVHAEGCPGCPRCVFETSPAFQGSRKV